MKKENRIEWAYTVLRILIGLMFVLMGYRQFLNTQGTIGMLTGLGFPIPEIAAWVLFLSEMIFGLCLVIGYKVKYTVWPLAVVISVAWITVVIGISGILSVSSFFHLITLAALILIAFNGPERLAVSRD